MEDNLSPPEPQEPFFYLSYRWQQRHKRRQTKSPVVYSALQSDMYNLTCYILTLWVHLLLFWWTEHFKILDNFYVSMTELAVNNTC